MNVSRHFPPPLACSASASSSLCSSAIQSINGPNHHRYVEIYNNVFHNLLEGVNGTPGNSSSHSNSATAAAARRSKSAHNNSRFSSDTGGGTPTTTPQTPPPPPPSTKIEVREHPSRGVFLSGGEGLRVPVRCVRCCLVPLSLAQEHACFYLLASLSAVE